ncbi:energy-coupling factor transporter ATPase [Niallia sp.]|uniref:energy-coupling factor transporter ATPase n=1 Tax=Niallia sp. TaxID=2837523 RepID=UPI00289C39F4|nr:energy-coupling factor transporter ATPase [Niallia sp.]
MGVVLEVKGLSFRYDKKQDRGNVSDVSFQLREGEWTALIGHNGSGKSTLAHLLVGLLQPDEGQIKINGSVSKKDAESENIGIVFQNPENQFIGTTVEDDVAFGLENLNMPYKEMRARVDKALEDVGMLDYRMTDPSQLSGGQKQRVAIAGMLALQPKVLILDEAFVMLDPRSRKELMVTIRKLTNQGMTILSITHDMDEAAQADKVIVMKQGQIMKVESPALLFIADSTLEKPFAEKLREALKSRKCEVPDKYMTEKEMVQWICKSN